MESKDRSSDQIGSESVHDRTLTRRALLVGAGAIAILGPASVVVALGDEWAHRIPRRSDRDAVTSFGALGDGVTDDAPAFREALATLARLMIPPGSYFLSEGLKIGHSDVLVSAAPGVTLIAGSVDPVLQVRNGSRFRLRGRGLTIDLAKTSSSGLRVVAEADSVVADVVIDDVVITNNSKKIEPGAAALELRRVSGARLRRVVVTAYGDRQDVWETRTDGGRANAQVYSVGLFECCAVSIEELRITDACVGVEIQKCDGVAIRDFSLLRGLDNGFYVLAGSRMITIVDGAIGAFEEGIVLLSPDITIERVAFANCTNKGVTLRHTTGTSIRDCRFSGEGTGIGDDSSGREVSNIDVVDCAFVQSAGRAIYLTTLADSRIEGGTFVAVQKNSDQLVRLDNARKVKIRSNALRDDEQETDALLAITGESEGCEVVGNDFESGSVAVKVLRSGGSPRNVTLRDNTYGSVSIPRAISAELIGIDISDS
ncbi:right-handed parallel beta-helix repeat-containing protein [Microbacterium radiodurans]|uniref:Right handed beta helix domain-containing protein n=1 Tax=Microbacterium radiodurans TaxID=661398 RepID=A0A5J5IR41_9MICO|nr:right-handed parallel beta-helix repeat-containing protein [Microbacterium radiodurans]KAA9084158.1 hypothetical protein F6B42_14360 [Microbacterium radiodurans]